MNIKELNCFNVWGKIKKSIETMDEFVNPEKRHDYMILWDWFRVYLPDQDGSYSVSLCICARKPDVELCEDDITMTHLRELYGRFIRYRSSWDGVPFGIYPSVAKTVYKSVAEEFETGEMIPLEYAVKLRAQTSRNRQGYGWEWDWSGGIGSYTEGTLYGETTDFYISHILVKKR